MKRLVTLISLFGILLVVRLFFIRESNNIILYITLINSISLIIVIVSTIEQAFESIKKEVGKRRSPEQIKKIAINDVKSKKNILYIINLVVLVGIIFSSELYNDALSIFTIGASLLDTEISNLFKKLLGKWCKL